MFLPLTLFAQEAFSGIRDAAGQPLGWTGYTFDARLFADPSALLSWMKRVGSGLHVGVNIHPRSGVMPWEQYYAPMALSMGIDPATQQYVACNLTDKRYVTNLYNLVLRPLQEQGVDFFWLDYQQDSNTSLVGVNPTFMLNYQTFSKSNDRRSESRMMTDHCVMACVCFVLLSQRIPTHGPTICGRC